MLLLRCQVLFLYPRAVMISNDSSKYNLVANNPSRSSIVQTYRISNNNWFEITTSNFQFTMTASPQQQRLSGSRVTFAATGVPSTTTSPIAGEKKQLHCQDRIISLPGKMWKVIACVCMCCHIAMIQVRRT